MEKRDREILKYIIFYRKDGTKDGKILNIQQRKNIFYIGVYIMSNLSIEIKRTNQKVHFEGISKDHKDIAIPFDFAQPIGDGNGFLGLELLLMSFTGCVSTVIVFLLGRSGKHISSYTAKADAIRKEHPLSLSEIHFHIRIESTDIRDVDIAYAIKQAEDISPVWLAVKNNVTVKITYELSGYQDESSGKMQNQNIL